MEALHYAALAPLFFLLAFRRDAGVTYWLVALGFAVSFFADFGAWLLGGSQALTYIYPAVQFGLFAWAFGQSWALPILLVLAAIQVVGTDLSAPDLGVTLAGSVIAIWATGEHPLVWSILAYCGLGTLCYMMMVERVWADSFDLWWHGYQGSRLLAFGLFGRAAWSA